MEEDRRVARITYGLVAANVAVFMLALVWQQTHGGESWLELDSSTLLRAGAAVSLKWGWGDSWRMWSSMFLHLSWLHLALNMYCLVRTDALEKALGWQRFAVLYGLSGLGGSLLSSGIEQTFLLSAGASGAIFGLFGATAVVTRGQVQRSLIWTILLNAGFGLSIAGVNNWAHLGGLLTGIVCVLAIRYRPESKVYPVILGLFALLSAWSLGRIAVPKGWDDYATQSYRLQGIELQLPLFFKTESGAQGSYLLAPGTVVACTGNGSSMLVPQQTGKWMILPASPKQPRVRTAVLYAGHRFWQLEVLADQPLDLLEKVLVHARPDSDIRLIEQVARVQQGKLKSSELTRPEGWGELMLLAEIQLKEKKSGAAQDTAGLAYRAAQNNSEKWASLAMKIRALEEQDLWQEAIAPADQMVELAPEFGESYNWRAWIFVHTKNLQEAKDQAEYALKLSPDQPHILDTYAAALQGLGETRKALEVMQRAERLDKSGSGTASKRLGEIWRALGDREKAVAATRKALKQQLSEKQRQEALKTLKALGS